MELFNLLYYCPAHKVAIGSVSLVLVCLGAKTYMVLLSKMLI